MQKKVTKTVLFFAMVFFHTTAIQTQNYMITFSGSGESSVVETVEVKNITQQTSITLNGSDTLHLVDVVGIVPIVQENAGMKVYPNPTRHTSRIEFYNPEAGNVSIEIIEITGKTLNAFSINISRGLQAFEIQGLSTGIYLVKAFTETTVHQQRLITYAQSFNNPQIIYLGSLDQGLVPVEMKSTKNLVVMQYNEGERLVIKAISGDYAHTKSLIPTQSQNIDFEFMDCIDGDGNQYGVAMIGEQVWMAENLKTTKYRNGTPIEYPGTNNTAWENNTTGAYAWYDNDISWKDSYGALYNWLAVNNTNSLCPSGWHVPTNDEWTVLTDYIGGTSSPHGNELKSCRQVNSPLGGGCNTSEHPRWNEHETQYGTDDYGFSGLPCGSRNSGGPFSFIGYYGIWWSSTEYSSYSAWFRSLGYYHGLVSVYDDVKHYGFSVRCLRD